MNSRWAITSPLLTGAQVPYSLTHDVFDLTRGKLGRPLRRTVACGRVPFPSRGQVRFDSPSRQPPIEHVDQQWRAGSCRNKRAARVEVQPTADYDKQKEKQADNEQCLFDLRSHCEPPIRACTVMGFAAFRVSRLTRQRLRGHGSLSGFHAVSPHSIPPAAELSFAFGKIMGEVTRRGFLR